MFEGLSTEDKIGVCEEQIGQIERQLYAQMMSIALDPDANDPADVVVDDSADGFVKVVQAEIVAGVARRAFIAGIKTALSA